jgi:AcrR family transcriptional regulator
MNTRQPVPQRGAERREDLTASALNVFIASGCFRTRVDAITADAGVGKSTLFANFGSQGELYAAAQRAAGEGLGQRCVRVTDQSADSHDAGLRDVIGDLITLARRPAPISPDTVSRLTCCNRRLHGQTETAGQDGGGSLAHVVRRWQQAGILDRSADPHWVSSVIMAVVSSPLVPDMLSCGPPPTPSSGLPRSSRRRSDAARPR